MASKTIVITGGTGGIGYQEALWLAGMKDGMKEENHTIVITGRNETTAQQAVETIQAETKNSNIHYAIADMSIQSQVHALAKELTKRFPQGIDELIHNAGNLSVGNKETTVDGVDKNFAVNVIAPLLLTRGLVPALKAASPTGKVQLTSGGLPVDTMDVSDPESTQFPAGLNAYSHSKRVMEAMAIALSRELEADGIAVNVVGGALPGATSMTKVISFSDLAWFMKPFYPCFAWFMGRQDNGKSAKACAKPCVLAVAPTAQEIGSGKSYLSYPKEGKFKKEIASRENQETLMKYVESKLV